MKDEKKFLLHILRKASSPLLAEAEGLSHLSLRDRKEKGEELEKKLEDLLQVKGPLYELEDALDKVRFIVRMARENEQKMARIA